MTRHAQAAIAAALLGGLAATSAHAQSVPFVVTARGDSLSSDTITFALRDGARAGTIASLRVPERRAARGAQRITIRWIHFASTATAPTAPIVFLAGGPGDAATRAFATMPSAFLDSLRAVGDVIAFDQRATGRSEPLLPCGVDGQLPLDRVLTTASRDSAARQVAQRCVAAIRARGVDVEGYTTAESVEDLESLRIALGVPTLSMLGGSYGTHLGLAFARRYPARASRIVLAGVEGPDDTFKLPSRVDASFSEVSRLAAADSAFRDRPSLLAVFDRLRARLDGDSVRVALGGATVALGAWDLQRFVADALGDMRAIQQLPSQLYAFDRGDWQLLARGAARRRQPRLGNAMNLLVNCASGASVARQQQIVRERATARLGDVIDFPANSVCTTLHVPRLPDAFRATSRNPSSILMVSGSLDGRTPPENAEALLSQFPNARHLVIEYQSHSLMGDAAFSPAMMRYLRGQDVRSARVVRPTPSFAR
ncbi:alpha/beta fold hydrolase [Gemmatimonas sp.]|uniref:alpha/beta fold hydrolase n=1 Tax=Gemmatimonas sp. TaxID=1962908 RepID=UPI00286BDFC4|nr:alpha/beta fold hydrolase [Gemmatimonas sp.]